MRCVFFLLIAAFGRADSPLQSESTPGGIRYGWLGEKPARPMPTVFFLGGAIEGSLNEPHFREGIDDLGPDVWCVTIDLPGHGAERRKGEPEALSSWRYRLERGDDFSAYFARRASAVLDHLIAYKHTDPARVGVFGTSRGGFMALHFAATDPRIRQVAVFAPVTDLTLMTEFANTTAQSRARALRTVHLVDRIHDRAIWIMIGSTNHRVGTASAIELAQRLIEAAEVRAVKPQIELHVEPSEGHRVPALSYARAAQWMRRQWDLPN